jgi:adenosylmethionine-8-amino-7-oxononanoate aminotransferase
VIVRGEGAYVRDVNGRRYLDGLAGLFAVGVGHGREELAAAKQSRELAYFPLWGHAHPAAIQLAERLATDAPGDLNRVFFTVSVGESVEAFGRWAADRIAEAIEFEGPDTVAAVFLAPLQTQAAASRHRPAISTGFAKSATPTTFCWCRTR